VTPCDHERLEWGCDPCRRRVAADQRLAELYDEYLECDDGIGCEPLDHIVDYATLNQHSDEAIASDVPWWPEHTVHEVMRAIRERWNVRADCLGVHYPSALRDACVREAWHRRRSRLGAPANT
jgi:hypothetical protein